jgi:hypothetical protein
VAEWSIAAVSKTVEPSRVPEVRILSLPPLLNPQDVELRGAVIEARNKLSEASFLTKAIWEIRTMKLLGVVTQ